MAPFWTGEEIDFLMRNPNLPTREASEVLGRGMRVIQAKRRHIKCGDVTPVNLWTPSEDDFVLTHPEMTARVVSEHLGRAETAVVARRRILATRHGVSFHHRNKNPNHPGDRRLLAKTCHDCGLLLSVDWFALKYGGRGRHGKGWRSSCTRCRSVGRPRGREPWEGADSTGHGERLQTASLPHANNHRSPWTEADHVVLSDPDQSVIAKAVELGRTYYATQSMCSENGYRSLLGKGDPVKGQWVIHNPNLEQTLRGEAS